MGLNKKTKKIVIIGKQITKPAEENEKQIQRMLATREPEKSTPYNSTVGPPN